MEGQRRRFLPSDWLLAETERVSALLLPFFYFVCCCCHCCHNCGARQLLSVVLLAPTLARLLLLAMNAVAQQHLFSWDPGQATTENQGEEEQTFVHTAVHAQDDVLKLFYVQQHSTSEEAVTQEPNCRSYLETILESSDDEDYASFTWTDSDRGTVVEVPLDSDNDDVIGPALSRTPSTDFDDEDQVPIRESSPVLVRNSIGEGSHNNDGCHDNAQSPSEGESSEPAGVVRPSKEYAAAVCLEYTMASRGEEDADTRLHRLLQRNSERETRMWLRANFSHSLLPSGEQGEQEFPVQARRRRWQSSPDSRRGCRQTNSPRPLQQGDSKRRASWPPDAAMQKQPICVRVTAAEIRSSSPCFALKLTPPPPRRRPIMTATGERPSILKTPSPTPPLPYYHQQHSVTTMPTPPPRRKHIVFTPEPVVPAPVTPFNRLQASPDTSSEVTTSPDVSLDVWTTSDVSFESFGSPEVSVELPMLHDISMESDTFHAVPCFLFLNSDAENSSLDVTTPHPAPFEEQAPPCEPFKRSSTRKPPLPPVRPPPISAKLTTGVKSRIACARKQYFDSQQAALNSQQRHAANPSALQDRFQQFCVDTQVERARLAVSVPDLPEQMRRSPSPSTLIDRPHAETPSPPTSSYRVQRPPPRPWPAPPAAGHISKSLGVLETDLDCEEPCTTQVTNLDTFLNRTASLMALREARTSAEDRARSMDFLLDDDNRASALPPENTLTGRVKSEHELRVERSLQNLSLPEWYKRKPQEGFLLKRDKQQRKGSEGGTERPTSQPLRWTGLGSRTPSSSSLTPGGVVIPKRVSRPDWRYVSSLRSSRESLQSSTASPDSISSSPLFSSWAAYRSVRTQPYLGWRYAASVGSSTAPSPAPSTPLPGSRPVSPGRWWQPSPADRSAQQPTIQPQQQHHQQQQPQTPQQPQNQDSMYSDALKNDPGNLRGLPRDRYSYIQSIYNGETPKLTNSNTHPAAKVTPTRSPASRSEDDQEDEEEKSSSSVFWMESSFVGSRSTTSVVVLPDEDGDESHDPVHNGDHPHYTKRGSKGNCSGDLSRSSTSERLGDSATSMEEVLDSLLAIPGSSRSSSPLLSRHTSPVLASTASPPSPVTTVVSATIERTVKFREPERDSSRGPSQLPSPYDDEDEEQMLPSPSSGQEERPLAHAENDIEPAPLGTGVSPRCETPSCVQQQSPARKSGVRNASIIRCRRPNCKRSLPTDEARAKFRTCSNCYTYYCSRHCRKAHWERHKAQCPQTRIANLCTQILMKVREEPRSRRSLSVCARRGFLSRGRGVVKLVFLSAEDALDYFANGRDSVRGQTFYVPRCDIMPQEMGSDVFGQVRAFCEKYNPDRKFILLVAISVMSTDGLEREVVVRGVKMRLATPLSEDEVQTLICTVTKDPPTEGEEAPNEQELRKGYDVIEAQLEERGVLLKDQYPDAYGKLQAFVERREPFVPLNIFPVDTRTGKMFMCILLPWADDDIIKMISSKTTVVRSKRRWIL